MIGLRAHVQRHHRLFQAGVAGAFADTVDRDFDLARAVLDAGQCVGGRQPQVVVTVAGEDDILAAGRVLAQIMDQRAVLFLSLIHI